MSNPQPFRWRTILEVGLISAVLYVFLGGPGFPSGLLNSDSGSTVDTPVPKARAKVENLVYPDRSLTCAVHKYDIRIFSETPLVILIDNFVSEAEANHLTSIRYVFSPLEHYLQQRIDISQK
jgi:prolyl 4-hydroxylase